MKLAHFIIVGLILCFMPLYIAQSEEGRDGQGDIMSSIFDLLGSDSNSNNKVKTVEPDYAGRNNSEIAIIPPLYSVEDIPMDAAKIIVTDINTGIHKVLEISKLSTSAFDKLNIKLLSCWKQGNALLSRESKALIVVTDQTSNDIIFDGWLFSKHKEFAQPKYKKFFITLLECYKINKQDE